MLSKLIRTFIILWLAGLISTHAVASREPDQTMIAARNAKSQEILKYMNETADPCENFYNFACGNWKTHHPSSEENPRTSAVVRFIEASDEHFPQLLSTIQKEDSEAELKVKYFFQSCRNSLSLNITEFGEKAQQIANEFLKMPALEGNKWQAEDFDWLQTVAEISYKYGINIITGYDLTDDAKDSTAYNLILCDPTFIDQNVSSIAADLQRFLGLETHLANTVAQEMVNFETSLITAYNERHWVRSDIEYLHQRYYPNFDVKRLLRIAHGSIPTGPIVYGVAQMEALPMLVNSTPKRVIANYIYFALFQEFMKQVPVNPELAESQCLEEVQQKFRKVVSYILYRANDFREAEQKVHKMWMDVQSNLQMILESNQLKWFDDSSREYALEKLHWLKIAVTSYKDFNLDVAYANLTVSGQQDYLENLKSLMVFNAAKKRADLTKVISHIDEDAILSSPAYLPLANAIVIPVAALLNDFFYTKEQPNVLQLPRLGFTLGHEVFHGFSGDGRKYNKMGKYIGSWASGVETEFDIRRQCFYDQYSSYTFGGAPLPQPQDQAENSADIGGILLAYKTYQSWFEDEARTQAELELEIMPNLNYTIDQVFFIYYAQTWCADTYDSQEYVNSLTAEGMDHSPDEFRAFVPLTNFEEFSRAFKCSLGTAMNPIKKCSIY